MQIAFLVSSYVSSESIIYHINYVAMYQPVCIHSICIHIYKLNATCHYYSKEWPLVMKYFKKKALLKILLP